jgi:2-iminobutanoate/2-iminopropanoate deaminase
LDHSERLLLLSGQVGMTRDGQVPEDPVQQFDLALANVIRNVKAAEMTALDIVKLTVYLTEPIGPGPRARILSEHLGYHTPCMTLLFVVGLATPRLKVEIDAWASSADRSDWP